MDDWNWSVNRYSRRPNRKLVVQRDTSSDTYEWRGVVGTDGAYEVSELGELRRMAPGRGTWPGRILSQYWHPLGGYISHISVGGAEKTIKVHREVANAFLGAPFEGQEVCHNDGDASNNRVANLRWDSRSANALDKARHGTDVQRNKTHCPHGHEYSDANTRIDKNGYRLCKTCEAANAKRWRQKRMKVRTDAA